MITNRVTRRSFLQATAAAAAAPYVITSSALGDAKKLPASERVALAIIGVGNRGIFHAFFDMYETGGQIVAIADAYKDRREAHAKMCKGKAYADFRDVLARPDIDAVVIATPDHWHVPIAIAAARAKKDCYVEKPLGISIEQDLACRKVFQETGRVFQYGTQQRSSNRFRLGCELVRNGRIGKLQAIEVVAPNGRAGGSTKQVPVLPTLDYDMWLGPAPVAPFTADRCHPPGSHMIYDYSIGFLAGWGAHPLDIMIWGCDADQSGLITVEGTGDIPTTGLYNSVVNWDMKLQLGRLPMTFKPGRDVTKFIGSEGWIALSRGHWDANPKSLLTSKIGKNEIHLISSPDHYSNFVNAIKSRKPTISPIDQAVRSDVISHLCDIAVRLKRKVTWDPKKEQIVGDAEATARLSRAMRAPWTI